MKYNLGFAPLVLIAIIVGVLAVGGGVYYMRNKEDIKNESNIKEVVSGRTSTLGNESSNLKEYTNKEVGFSFKYPATVGDIKVTKTLGPNGEGYGYWFRGLAGEYPYSFFFDYQTKDYNGNTGDSGETGYENNKIDDCIQKDVSCENIKSKDGLGLKLAKNLNAGTVEPYSFRVSLPGNVVYKNLLFISSDKTLLTNIASEFKIIKPKVDGCSVWLTYQGAYSVKYPGCWSAEGMKGGSIGTANSEVGVILKPSPNSSYNDSISIGGWQYECSDVNFSNKSNSLTKAYCFKSENGNKWIGEYISLSNPYDSKNLFYVPVVTSSSNPEVLKMFDLIVKNNQ